MLSSERSAVLHSGLQQVVSHLAVMQLLIETMKEMNLGFPTPHVDVRALKKVISAAG